MFSLLEFDPEAFAVLDTNSEAAERYDFKEWILKSDVREDHSQQEGDACVRGNLQRTSWRKMKLTSLSKVRTQVSQPSYWEEEALL